MEWASGAFVKPSESRKALLHRNAAYKLTLTKLAKYNWIKECLKEQPIQKHKQNIKMIQNQVHTGKIIWQTCVNSNPRMDK